jgi:murein DD-endopeptidase MepM/ murein hydrolase activator NlpD
MKLTVPAKTAAETAGAQAADAAPQPAASMPPATRVAAIDPQQKARLAQSTTVEDTATETPVRAAEATGALPTFRWPVRGKVITSYGAKTNGKANDGINLAVPEGTPVKAAEDGVVAYSGNELKGYGNLVLIRHTNGYVTAYAHASELLVKRGDTIKRGQIIAKSGQSGEVGSPQLHFEIRKGSSPVDPLQFLNGA